MLDESGAVRGYIDPPDMVFDSATVPLCGLSCFMLLPAREEHGSDASPNGASLDQHQLPPNWRAIFTHKMNLTMSKAGNRVIRSAAHFILYRSTPCAVEIYKSKLLSSHDWLCNLDSAGNHNEDFHYDFDNGSDHVLFQSVWLPTEVRHLYFILREVSRRPEIFADGAIGMHINDICTWIVETKPELKDFINHRYRARFVVVFLKDVYFNSNPLLTMHTDNIVNKIVHMYDWSDQVIYFTSGF